MIGTMKFFLRHRKSYRTRIQFPVLRKRYSVCRELEKKLVKDLNTTKVEVRPITGSIIIEHPDQELSIERLVLDVEDTLRCLPDVGKTSADFSAGPCCRASHSDGEEGKYHVSGTTLVLSGMYLLYLFTKRVFGAIAVPASLTARIFTLPAVVAIGLSLPIQRQAVDNLRKNGKPDMGLISTVLLYLSILTGNAVASLTVFWLFNLSSWLEDRIRIKTRQAVRDMLTGKVKKAFGDFSVQLEKAQKNLQTAEKTIATLSGTRTRAIERVLRGVEELEIDNADEAKYGIGISGFEEKTEEN